MMKVEDRNRIYEGREMTPRHCKNDDGGCPCLWEGMTCKLLPEWKRITDTEIHYCYSGRQIMEEQTSFQGLKDWELYGAYIFNYLNITKELDNAKNQNYHRG